MSRGALLTGVAGGIIGAITMAIGLAWMILSLVAASNIWILFFGPEALFVALTILVAVLLVVTCILTGIGFYGIGQIGGGGMGIASLIIGIILGSATGILLLAGAFTVSLFDSSTLLVLLSTITLAVTFIIFGSASIVMREVTMRSSAMMAAGIIGIIGGVLVFLIGLIGYPIMFVSFIIWAIVFYSSREM